MITDILMAFAFALLIQIFLFIGTNFKRIIVFTFCITIIFIYFITGCKIDFISQIDFAIWITFIIMFNEMLNLAKEILFIKNTKSYVTSPLKMEDEHKIELLREEWKKL